ncbi:hypothetical protein SAMN05216207_100279 [Pseudonocardia ammonioxydans]|uniref:STAS domain-containing protein n=1 Tax=Pseudonocardia ammonioxydans TaxID=260086 RepID=A0A1I4T3B1_PSUAM|nr:hypothetical protein [Pseudonocardia ammonioxydans]SFM71202.1 hypothetical protein SAMN05216207_100279 [Pseudonocardia ammonioxydans]
MDSNEPVQITVEVPDEGIRLVRVAGRLDRAGADGVLRLVSAQLELAAARRRAVRELVVDIGSVSCFEPGGLERLGRAVELAAGHAVGLSVSGCGGRVHLLPLGCRRTLSRFRTYPTADVALAALAGDRPAGGEGPPAVPAPRPPVEDTGHPGHTEQPEHAGASGNAGAPEHAVYPEDGPGPHGHRATTPVHGHGAGTGAPAPDPYRHR